MKLPHLSFAHLIERQASTLSASLVLPKPNSDNFCMRLSRFPNEGTETILDIHTVGARVFVTVTRFLNSLRERITTFSNDNCQDSSLITVDISISELSGTDPIIREILSNQIFDIKSDLNQEIKDNHFFLFFTDSQNCVTAAISNPFQKLNEQWVRLINRSYGTELIAPRRDSQNLYSSI